MRAIGWTLTATGFAAALMTGCSSSGPHVCHMPVPDEPCIAGDYCSTLYSGEFCYCAGVWRGCGTPPTPPPPPAPACQSVNASDVPTSGFCPPGYLHGPAGVYCCETCEREGLTSPDDSGTCPSGYEGDAAPGCCVPVSPCVMSADPSLSSTVCMPPGSDASSSDAGSDAVSDAPSNRSVDGGGATIDAPADAGGQ
jgi:hypothetical protein